MYNTAVGRNAGLSVTTGARNTLLGSLTGSSINTGSENTCIGYAAGDAITTGSNNIIIGQSVDRDDATGDNAIVIGVGFVGASNDFSFGKASNVSNDFNADANWSRSSDESELKKKKHFNQDQTLGCHHNDFP